MKKVILSAIAVLAFGFTNAQDLKSSKGEVYLPEAGDWAISFNADGIFQYVGNSFNGNVANAAPTVNFARANSFVGKMFITDKQAYRVVANLGFASNTVTTPAALTTNETKTTGFNLAAGLGKEWRRGKTRLQGFYGADALITVSSLNTTVTTTDNANGNFLGSIENKDGLGFGLGVQGFIGAEYFIFPKFSLGAQYTYRVGFDLTGKSQTTVTPAVGNSTTTEGGKNTNFGIGNVGVASINLTLHF